MEPWLDSLSEDWNSLPRSSVSRCLSESTPSKLGNHNKNMTPAKTSGSRIPRLKSSNVGSSPAAKPAKLTARLPQPNVKRALSERRNSDINIALSSSSAPDARKPIRPRSDSETSSAISSNSVVHHNLTNARARSASPPRSRRTYGTPEWKKLIRGDAPSSQQNLFSPLALESIFQRPKEDGFQCSQRGLSGVPFLSDADSIPSSPPPWPSSHRGSKLSFARKQSRLSQGALDILSEQEEEQQPLEIEVSVVRQDETGHGARLSDGGHIRPTEVSIKNKLHQKPTFEPEAPADEVKKGEVLEIIPHLQSAVASPECSSAQLILPQNAGCDSVTSGTVSAFSDSFSPVFISKHNTVDGKVDYAALDMSDPVIRAQLQKMRPEGIRDDGNSQNSSSSGSTTAVGHDCNANSEPQTPEITQISEFVSVERGGQSNDSSFQRRPLSPSHSSSLVPSDSVSQVNENLDTILDRFPLPSDGTPYAQKQSAIVTRPFTPSNKSQNQTGISVDALRPQSSGSPLKLFGNYDTFTNNRLIRRMSRLKNFDGDADGNESSAKEAAQNVLKSNGMIDIEPSNENRSGDEGHQPVDIEVSTDTVTAIVSKNEHLAGVELSLAKRPASSPFKPPTPKRQRTLHNIELPQTNNQVGHNVLQHDNRTQSIIGKKRKDARYDNDQQLVNPEEMSRREILQPRNSVAGQGNQVHNSPEQELISESFTSNASKLEVVQGHIEQIPLPSAITNPQQIRAVAAEVATFTFNALPHLTGDVRKQSVSTQDYLDEAMKIMNFIRTQQFPQPDLPSLEVSGIEGRFAEIAPSTPLAISRPPSREGAGSHWKERNVQHDTRVMSYLKKYQEDEEESFIGSSNLLYDKPTEGEHNNIDDVQTVPANIRITENINKRNGENEEDFAPLEDVQQLEAKSPKTHRSNMSTDSAGRSVQTSSSQRTRTLPVIAPDRVTHLINGAGAEAGMRFDTEKQAWVKCKNMSLVRIEEFISSSTTGTEDPFGQIPDLSVNEDEEQLRTRPASHNILQDAVDDSVLQLGEELDMPSNDSAHRVVEKYQPQSSIHRSVTGVSGSSPQRNILKHLSKRPVAFLDESQDELIVKTASLNFEEPKYSNSDVSEVKFAERLASLPTDTVRSKTKRRDTSVLFSSPVVSQWCEAGEWTDPIDVDRKDAEVDDSLYNEESSTRRHQHRQHFSAAATSFRKRSTSQQEAFVAGHQNYRNSKFTQLDEHHEVSLVETRPDGRTLSLTLSVSTPIPSRRAASIQSMRNSGLRNRIHATSLSPLSEFTVHQDDKQHLQSRGLIRQTHQIILAPTETPTALAVDGLVEKLTDAEPEELFWESMRTLNLENKRLKSVYELDCFCPEVEDLNLSNNTLSQLEGIPQTVRHLTAQNNWLTSLTSWGHLNNLQYLDVSSNDIESLDAFSNLIHLRDLTAANNKISNIDGILDLDALLRLNLKGNFLQDIDFQGCQLKRLSELNLSSNVLTTVRGLQHLPHLSKLEMNHNRLSTIQSDTPLLQLQCLRIESNSLEHIQFSDFPGLRSLHADKNHLSSLSGIEELRDIHTLSIRDQTDPENGRPVDLSASLCFLSNLHHLYLSNNRILQLDMQNRPYLNLRTLEIASTGLQCLPPEFSRLCPNIRTLNLNSNAVNDIKPLRSIRKLQALHIAGNRLARLRRTLAIVSSFTGLKELDLRDNHFSIGFHAQYAGQLAGPRRVKYIEGNDDENISMEHVLPDGDVARERQYTANLDEDTLLRRRVYELLLATHCLQLRKVDGLVFEREEMVRKDAVWERLVGLGVVECVSLARE